MTESDNKTDAGKGLQPRPIRNVGKENEER